MATATNDQIATTPAPTGVDGDFGAEFRELARQRRFVRQEPTAATAPPATPATSTPPASDWRASTPAAAPIATAATPARATATQTQRAPRISDDAAVMLAELARMSDRLVESREALATERARADHAEAQLSAANDRLMAARALVHDAQRATHASAEQVAWLEGRNETLEDALHLAVNSSVITRWRWRRQLRTQSADQA